jgi:hypothetical protein
VTHGLYPLGKIHGDPQPSTGQGRIVSEGGAVVFRGPVLPGGHLFFQIAYNIPYHQEKARLAAVSDILIKDAAASVRWTHLVHPKVRLERPHRAVRYNQDGVEQVDLLLTGDLRAGEPFVIDLGHLPIQTTVPRLLAVWGGGGILLVFVLMLIGFSRRPRRKELE